MQLQTTAQQPTDPPFCCLMLGDPDSVPVQATLDNQAPPGCLVGPVEAPACQSEVRQSLKPQLQEPLESSNHNKLTLQYQPTRAP